MNLEKTLQNIDISEPFEIEDFAGEVQSYIDVLISNIKTDSHKSGH